MSQTANLDALVPREDFEVIDIVAPATQIDRIQVRDLEPGAFFYAVVRKPDFQRETSDWIPSKITAFIQSFLDGDLIPALILWQAGSQIFLIDGAHRLSALIAWVHDDYGDGPTSKKFFDGVIPDEQNKAAAATRAAVKAKFGSYADLKFAVANADKAKLETVERAKRLAALSIQLQWVRGDATKAEASFFKINQQASPIDKTELRLLQARTHPNALAARAIVRSGTGHKYWSRFDDDRRSEIEKLARQINELLFTPSLKTPIRTLDLPVAGRGYSAQTVPLVLEFVNLANGLKGEATGLKADLDGTATVALLERCRELVTRIAGTTPTSLGLHPIVYFYSSTGRYQPTSFLAFVELLKELEAPGRLAEFIKVRRQFEEFLLRHRAIVNQMTVRYGSGSKGYARLQRLFDFLIQSLAGGLDEAGLLTALAASDEFSFLQPNAGPGIEPGKLFSLDAKSEVFLRDALKDPVRCGICGGLIHRASITIDHVTKKSAGGTGAVENGQLAHPYCNSVYKH